MKMRWTFALLTTLVIPLSSSLAQTNQENPEWGSDTPYYEDDAWYDVTEWFDGNDYNPTDEQVAEIDDETWQESDEVGGISDNDRGLGQDEDDDVDVYDDNGVASDGFYDDSTNREQNRGDLYTSEDYPSYGYLDYNDNDWFYDYYDEGYASYTDFDNDGLYDYSYRYYDYDNDGQYDALVSYTDTDDDGLYDEYSYFTFNDAGTKQQKQQARQQADRSAYSHSVTGEIKSMKRVAVRDTKHMVVTLQRQEGDRVIADLGPVAELYKFDFNKGNRINVKGPISKVGEKQVLMAKQIRAEGDSAEVYRTRRTFQGQVTSTKETSLRGKKHLIAMLETNRAGRERAVDLGRKENLTQKIHKGVELTVQGVPVKARDSQLVMAQSITVDGKEMEINRQEKNNQRQTTARRNRANNKRNNEKNRNRSR